MIKLTTLLTELRVIDLAKDDEETTKYFLLYKDKLFLLDSSSPFRTLNSRIKSHVKPHPGLNKDSKYGPLQTDDFGTFIGYMSETAPDIVVGEYYPEKNAIIVWNGAGVLPKSSLNVKKIVKQLGIETVTYRHIDYTTSSNDDIEVDYKPKQLQGGIPDVAFHGTDSNSLSNILKYGIDPGRGEGKFKDRGIIHRDHVFFTSTFEEALYYAYHSRTVSKKNKKWHAYPIIIEFKIPDKSLIYQDYDADISTTSPRHFQRPMGEPRDKAQMKAMGLSRETGKWSYKGRIPASHILWVYYYKPFEKVWKKSRPETWSKLLDRSDWETLGYRLGLNSEDDM